MSSQLHTYAPPSFSDKIRRGIWGIFYHAAFRFSPIVLHRWRCGLLRAFGASIGDGVAIYPDAKIWAPWNLVIGNRVTVGPEVELYNVTSVELEDGCIVSQRAVLCAATHDIRSPTFQLLVGRIAIGQGAWVAMEAFIGPGVKVGARSVVGARAVVFRDMSDGVVVVGNPAKEICRRGTDGRNNLNHIR